MAVSGTSGTSGTSNTNNTVSGATTGIANNFDQFLLLLTTQLKNQSPLDPLDTNQFTAQLVQFAGVEQQLKTNETLGSLLSLSAAGTATNAVGFIGAKITAVASGVPVGWGDPVYDRLDAVLAYAMMGINAAKGVEVGAGFKSVSQKGTEHGDEMTPEGFLSNNAGGVLGGISTGQDIVVNIAIKPTSSIRLPRKTIDLEGHAAIVETHGRHDPCVGIRATPIAEAMLALTLIDAAMHHRAQCGDVVCATPKIPGKVRS